MERDLAPTQPCDVSRSSDTVRIGTIPKLDLLLVVDNSASMADEQLALRAQFPNLIRILTTGQRVPEDPDPAYPLQDLRVGVISSDMDLPGGVSASAGCRANGADDGRLQHAGRSQDCQTSYPSFLSFINEPALGPLTDAAQLTLDLACIGDLGTGGCGYEQQLEAPFKALWPKHQLDASGNAVIPNAYRFLSASEPGTWGRGDQPAAEGGNLGFLRNDRRSCLPSLSCS